MKVELSNEAAAQVQRINGWWQENRAAAPDLFTEELDRALLMLAEAPSLSARYEPKPPVRRVLLRRSHYHLYFLEEPERVYVIAVWNVFQGRGPRL
jgi:plasmid stabilization system protein ParE